jgi:Flp pilus assembly protein TadB
MSATRPSRQRPQRRSAAAGGPAAPAAPAMPAMPAGSEPRDISLLRARRREADRRRRLLRLDLALGVLGAIVLLLATPGLAIAAVVAGVLLAVCVVSVLVERRRRAKR